MGLNRRTFMASSVTALGTPSLGATTATRGLQIDKPLIEHLSNPLGLEEPFPRFSWRLVSGGRNVRQRSYRIRVASSLVRLGEDHADIWDSGKIVSRRSVDVPYAGPALRSGQRCFWTVEVTDNKSRIARSAPSWWEMGLLAAGDWQASWLIVEDHAGKASRTAGVAGEPTKKYPAQPAMLLRRRFFVPKRVVSARLYATALGVYEASINGKAVSRRKLAPELTDYRKRLLYQVYDVTPLIGGGENVLGAMVGEGWYGSPYTFSPKAYMFGEPPCRFLAKLVLAYADGSTEHICSDGDWRTTASPILMAQIYAGETFDARKELRGWDRAGFDDGAWVPVEIGEAPAAALEAQVSPPIQEVMTLKPAALTFPKPGIAVFDFGQNFAGCIRLRAKGPAGTEVKLRFAEYLSPAGLADQANLRSAKATATYILSGDPEGEIYEPHFTYFGFRHVELSGFPGEVTAQTLTGVVASSDLPVTGRFCVGNPVIQKFWQNAVWSQRSNFMGIPTDCPQRDERMGWVGDAQVFWDAASFNMDTDAFANRFMGDIRTGQSANGALPEVTPIAMGEGAFAGAPGWADGGVIIPWTVYRHYGDTAIIDRNWSAMARWIKFVLDGNPDFIWRNNRGSDWGDWLAVDAKQPGDETTSKALIGTAFWAHSTALMAEMAKATTRLGDYAYYLKLHEKIAAAFQSEFVGTDGKVGNGSQTSHILPLAFGLIPQSLQARVAEELVSNIRARGTKLSTGFLGTPYILDVLAANGYDDVAIDLLLQTGYPSWGYMVMKGATTMWERWNSDSGDLSMNSFNHYAFGAISAFMYRRLAGIDQDRPGFESVVIRPICDGRLKFAAADYESVHGRISTEWRRKGRHLTLNVTVPPNVDAAVHIPASAKQIIREGGHLLGAQGGIPVASRDNRRAVVLVGSGRYRFSVM